MFKRVVGFVLLAVVALAASGCAGTYDGPPTQETVVGTWRADDGSVLTVNSDGNFVASGFSDTRLSMENGSGTWEARAAEEYSSAGVDLSYWTARGGRLCPVSYRAEDASLYEWIGDPDEGKRFKLYRDEG